MIITNSPIQSFQNQTIGMTAILTSGEAPGDHDDKGSHPLRKVQFLVKILSENLI